MTDEDIGDEDDHQMDHNNNNRYFNDKVRTLRMRYTIAT